MLGSPEYMGEYVIVCDNSFILPPRVSCFLHEFRAGNFPSLKLP